MRMPILLNLECSSNVYCLILKDRRLKNLNFIDRFYQSLRRVKLDLF